MQEEAARQQVPHGGSFGKVAPTGVQMPPPGMQRMQHIGGLPNPQQQQQQQQNLPMSGPGTSSNLLPMNEWGHRYPNNANQPGLRPPNPNQMMQQNPMQQQQQQVSFSVFSICFSTRQKFSKILKMQFSFAEYDGNGWSWC